jgi:hypothetical protein
MYNKNSDINIFFEYLGNKYTIISKNDELLSTIFEKFKNKIGKHKERFSFYNNGKLLSSEKRLRDVLLKSNNNTFVTVIQSKNGFNGGEFD